MSLELCILGSGSSGNSTVVRAAQGTFLIDAGFGPRTTDVRMHGIGLAVKNLSAIVLTHLDHDHFNPHWLQTIVKNNIRVFVAQARRQALLHLPEARDIDERLAAKNRDRVPFTPFADLLVPFEGDFQPVPGVHISPLELAHDAAGSHGFVLESDGYRVGFATDLGHVPDVLIERFCGVDVLALESNYDRQMEITADRPWFLKQRVMGGRGHLSNDQALAAIRTILDRTAETCGPGRLPRHIVLLHRSQQCNCPKLLRKLFTKDARISPVLTLTEQSERTSWLSAARPRAQVVQQLALAFG